MTTIGIRWHGRGGQGAITAAKIVAKAAFDAGYTGVTMAPTFGTERRGAPVSTSLKLSKTKIYDLSPIKNPDLVVVLDHTLLDEVDVTAGLKAGGTIILNTPYAKEHYRFEGFQLATASINALAVDAGLRKEIVNSGIIGAFARASELIPDFAGLLRHIEAEFEGKRPQQNAKAAELAFAATDIDAAPKAVNG